MTAALRLLAIAGTCLTLGLAACSSEQKVEMNELPSAVRATLERETAGGTVTEIEKETKDGKTVYSADAMVGGQAWDITIAEDGKVISKEMEKAGENEKYEKKPAGR